MIQDSQAKKMPLLNISLSFKIPKKLIHIISCTDLLFVKFIPEMKIRKILREWWISENKYYLSTGNNVIKKSIKNFRSNKTDTLYYYSVYYYSVLFRHTVKCLYVYRGRPHSTFPTTSVQQI